MKKYFITAILICAFFDFAYGASEENENDPCKTIIAFQPQANDIVEAASVFNIYMTLSACSVKDKIKLNTSQYMSLISFSHTNDGHKFEYSITTFGKGNLVTKRTCKISSHYEHPAGSSLDTLIEMYSSPKCSKDIVIQ